MFVGFGFYLFNAYLWILITSPEVNFHVDICYTDENGTAISPPLPNQIFVFFLLLGVDRLMILKIRRTRCAVIRTESHESPIFKWLWMNWAFDMKKTFIVFNSSVLTSRASRPVTLRPSSACILFAFMTLTLIHSRYKLIADIQLENNTWYKDEGGKRNCIKAHVQLVVFATWWGAMPSRTVTISWFLIIWETIVWFPWMLRFIMTTISPSSPPHPYWSFWMTSVRLTKMYVFVFLGWLCRVNVTSNSVLKMFPRTTNRRNSAYTFSLIFWIIHRTRTLLLCIPQIFLWRASEMGVWVFIFILFCSIISFSLFFIQKFFSLFFKFLICF